MTDVDKLGWLARTPYSAAVYMHAHGWQMLGTTSTESLWSLESDGQTWEALLPLDVTRNDGLRRMSELLSVLSAVEERTTDDLVRDLRTAQSDVIRVRATPDSESGWAPIEDALQIVAASCEMLLAAASAVDAPRAVLPPRKPDRALDFLRSVQFSTEPGSFVVALEAPVAPDLESVTLAAAAADASDALFPDPRVPFPRRVTELLVTAIDNSLRACAEVAAGEEIMAFDSTIPDGVSANLLEALVRLGGGADRSQERAREFGITVRWSYGRRSASKLRRSYVITRDAIPVFSAAAASLRARKPEPDVTLTGQVVGLRRDDTLETDTVTVSAYVSTGDSGRIRNVRLVLEDPAHHQLVSRAYESRDLVVVSGDLQPSGFQLTMHPVTSIGIVTPENADITDSSAETQDPSQLDS